MERDIDKWMENIVHSMKDSKRAQPNSNLFKKIENEINNSELKNITRLPIRYAAAAAVILLMVNSSALYMFTKQNQSFQIHSGLENSENTALITSFQIYE